MVRNFGPHWLIFLVCSVSRWLLNRFNIEQWNTVKEIMFDSKPIEHLLGSGTVTLHWLLMLCLIWYQAPQISPHDVYRIKLLIWVWMVFWKQSATYLHNCSFFCWCLLLLLLTAVFKLIGEMLLNWEHDEEFFFYNSLIETRNTRLLWKIWLSWSVNELHPGHSEMYSTWCFSSSILEIFLQLRLMSFLTSTSKFGVLELCFIQY